MSSRVLVTGASGFVGSALCTALVAAGHSVRAMTRHPDTYPGAGEPVYGDVSDPSSLSAALSDVDAAYYLVHSLDDDDFQRKDAEAARNFSAAAAGAGLERIIYLGGLGKDDSQLSPHLKSRREVERLLAADGVPVTVLRAAVVVGHGGISWEITRQLVAHLPVMVGPHWVTTKTQPIALADVVRYLVGVLEPEEARGQVFEVGGPDILNYAEMLQRVARVRYNRALPLIVVPLLTPGLSSRWLALVTNVNVHTGRNLVDSMTNEVVVTDDSITRLVPGPTMGYDDAVRQALADRAKAAERAKTTDRTKPATKTRTAPRPTPEQTR